MKFPRTQARHRRRHNSPTSPTSGQSSAHGEAAQDPIFNTGTSTSISTNTNSSSSSEFIQQNPRYASLWLQKCLLPKRLTPSTLIGATPHYLSPNCYPYPSMADSVDRVFVHALHTVKRLPRTGSSRPPERDRLALYGLYKQATEGDVAGLLPRRTGSSKEDVAEREKWDAWHANGGMGKTEAKRAYIEALIGTMRKYAMSTAEARELVGELEFVWDQIRDGSGGSGGSGGGGSPEYGGSKRGGVRRRRGDDEAEEVEKKEKVVDDNGGGGEGRRVEGLKVLRPMSEGDEVEDDDDDDDDEEEEEDFQDPDQGEDSNGDMRTGGLARLVSSGPGFSTRATDLDVRNRKWRKRMELALGKLSVEIAALREQIESQRGGAIGRTGGGVLAWGRWLLAFLMRHLAFDGALLLLLLVWARRKGDRRIEQGLQLFYYWIREQFGKIKVPNALSRVMKPL